MAPPRITGTFLDEITHDIPSQNWGVGEWSREFALYPRIGIDAAIVIRAGYRDRCIFPSRTLGDILPAYEDLGQLFLELGERHGVGVWFGLYDSGRHWLRGAWWKELEVNRAFVDELAERYADSPAFAGWYIPHETSRNELDIARLYRGLGEACKGARPAPVLISPFPQGAKQFSGEDVMGLDESLEHWHRIFEESAGAFDICAFQDGQVHYRELPRFLDGIKTLGSRHGVRIWSNLETFDRDMPIRFPPADWRNVWFKLAAAANVAEKIVTFEFPHFMSPHSSYPSARNLFARYCEFAGIDLATDG